VWKNRAYLLKTRLNLVEKMVIFDGFKKLKKLSARLFKKRPTFYYDPETCTYHQEVLTVSQRIKRASSYFVASVVFGLIALGSYEYYFHQIKEDALNQENLVLQAKLGELNAQLDKYEETLEGIHEHESGIYASIMESEALSAQTWEGGMGGTSKHNLSNATLPTQMKVRMELMNYRVRMLKGSLSRISDHSHRRTEELKTLPAIRPVNIAGTTFMSGFGYRVHPVTGHGHLHAGLDFACPIGTPIYATGNGKVTFAGNNGHGYGNYVDINHGNGYLTKYAHMSSVVAKEGQMVKRGDLIGYVGNTGLSTGPHLHYEIEKNGEKIDPMDFFYDISPTEYLAKKEAAAQAIPLD
jgi:murein DD-endopeptidase MepM/ murein hydrolase activator NlpD